jgi:hypothetical protein
VIRARAAGILVSMAVAGCGGASGPSVDEAAARHTVQSWLSAVARHDGRAACAAVSTRLQQFINRHLLGEGVKGTCNTWAAKWVSPRHAAARPGVRIEALRIRGSRATVRLVAPGAFDAQAKLIREHGHWRIDDY